MIDISDDAFDKLISSVMDDLPQKYIEGLNNVLITYEDEPTAEQRATLRLRCNETLYGLYEGIPRTERMDNYNLVLPDRITIFKKPLAWSVSNLAELREEVRHTLWHEIAHYYGLDHDRIHELESKE